MTTVCDLHETDVLAVASARVVGIGADRALDVCAEHLAVLEGLPAAAAPSGARAGGSGGALRDGTGRVAARAGDREPGAGSARAGRRPGSRRSLQQERALVREWARQQGRDVGDKGRLPSGLVEDYRRTRG
jgi:hypothetical protein